MWNKNKLTLLVGILFVFFSLMLAVSPVDAEPISASDYVSTFGEEAIAVLNNEQLSSSDRQVEFHRLFKRGFNVPAISRFALGRHWRTLTDNERYEYVPLFEDYVIAIYSQRLESFSGERLVIVGETTNDRHTTVRSQLFSTDNVNPVRTDWRLQLSNGRWYIVDVVVEGLSMAITLRSDFASVIKRRGIEGLLNELRDKVQG